MSQDYYTIRSYKMTVIVSKTSRIQEMNYSLIAREPLSQCHYLNTSVKILRCSVKKTLKNKEEKYNLYGKKHVLMHDSS